MGARRNLAQLLSYVIFNVKKVWEYERLKRHILRFSKYVNVGEISYTIYACNGKWAPRPRFARHAPQKILLLPYDKSLIVQIYLYGSDKLNPTINEIIFTIVIDYIIHSKGHDNPLIQY